MSAETSPQGAIYELRRRQALEPIGRRAYRRPTGGATSLPDAHHDGHAAGAVAHDAASLAQHFRILLSAAAAEVEAHVSASP